MFRAELDGLVVKTSPQDEDVIIRMEGEPLGIAILKNQITDFCELLRLARKYGQ